jgi:hypothetical protein
MSRNYEDLSAEEKAEIKKRIAAHREKMAPIIAARKKNRQERREASEYLIEAKAHLCYHPIGDYNVGMALVVDKETKHRVNVAMAYTIMSPKDHFSRPDARKYLAERLQEEDEFFEILKVPKRMAYRDVQNFNKQTGKMDKGQRLDFDYIGILAFFQIMADCLSDETVPVKFSRALLTRFSGDTFGHFE